MKPQRLDQYLVESGQAKDLAHARGLIMAGQVVVDDQRVDKSGVIITPNQSVRVKGKKTRFVGRGGEKLAGAIADFSLADLVQGAVAADIGASTGGFTDCLLRAGAANVVCIDVGTNQLAYELRSDRRVQVFEKCDVRLIDIGILPPLSLVVADVSFNSLARLAEAFWRLPSSGPLHYLLLVKPQFELPSSMVGKGGIVHDIESHELAVKLVEKAFTALGGTDFMSRPSQVAGRSGNREYFLKFVRPY